MTATTDNPDPASHSGALTRLRAFAPEPPSSIGAALAATDQQAALMRRLLPISPSHIPAAVTDVIPSITVQRVEDIPVAATSFWANGHWQIHVRASDPADLQTFTVLHQLKHIIDHPLREAAGLSEIDREAVANHFANRVLATTPKPTRTSPHGEERL